MTLEKPRFQELLKLAQGGCRDSFDELVRRYEPAIRRFFDKERRRTNQLGIDATGVVQDALFSIWLNLANFRGTSEAEFIAWCRTILDRDFKDEARNRKAIKRGGGRLPISTDQSRDYAPAFRDKIAADITTPSQKFARKEILQRAIQKVPKANRDVIRLFYLENQTHDEIAKQLSLPFDETIDRFRRGARVLRRILTEMGEHERRREEQSTEQ